MVVSGCRWSTTSGRKRGSTASGGGIIKACCNGDKGINELNFRNHSTTLTKPPESIRPILAKVDLSGDVDVWGKILRRIINFFYRCAAVNRIVIGRRGQRLYHWEIELYAGNNPNWLKPFLKPMVKSIWEARDAAKKKGPDSLTVSAPGYKGIVARR